MTDWMSSFVKGAGEKLAAMRKTLAPTPSETAEPTFNVDLINPKRTNQDNKTVPSTSLPKVMQLGRVPEANGSELLFGCIRCVPESTEREKEEAKIRAYCISRAATLCDIFVDTSTPESFGGGYEFQKVIQRLRGCGKGAGIVFTRFDDVLENAVHLRSVAYQFSSNGWSLHCLQESINLQTDAGKLWRDLCESSRYFWQFSKPKMKELELKKEERNGRIHYSFESLPYGSYQVSIWHFRTKEHYVTLGLSDKHKSVLISNAGSLIECASEKSFQLPEFENQERMIIRYSPSQFIVERNSLKTNFPHTLSQKDCTLHIDLASEKLAKVVVVNFLMILNRKLLLSLRHGRRLSGTILSSYSILYLNIALYTE